MKSKTGALRFAGAGALALAAALSCAAPVMGGEMGLLITSDAFDPGAAIPARHTCDGADRSPPLAWHGVPEGTKVLALIVDDPDAPDPAAPKRIWVHWVLHDLPPDTPGLPEGVAPADLPGGTREGTNDWGRTGYGGPCPPIGRHRYFFRLYALDRALGDLGAPTRARLLAAMEGHVLASAELMGTYSRGESSVGGVSSVTTSRRVRSPRDSATPPLTRSSTPSTAASWGTA